MHACQALVNGPGIARGPILVPHSGGGPSASRTLPVVRSTGVVCMAIACGAAHAYARIKDLSVAACCSESSLWAVHSTMLNNCQATKRSALLMRIIRDLMQSAGYVASACTPLGGTDSLSRMHSAHVPPEHIPPEHVH